MYDRRAFLETALRGSALLSLAPVLPAFLARTAGAVPAHAADGRILVVIFLDGGNDGINTVIPHRDEGYAKHRKALYIPPERRVRIDDDLALNRSFRSAATLLERGQLAIVQGVSYPNPTLSHFRSRRIWHTADVAEPELCAQGWLGLALDPTASPRRGAQSIYVGDDNVPVALRGRRSAPLSLSRPEDVLIDDPSTPTVGGAPGGGLHDFVRKALTDARASSDRVRELVARRAVGADYPQSKLGDKLRLVAQMIKAQMGARVYYASQSGYDTHGAQAASHGSLLFELGGAMLAFIDDLVASKLDDRVTVLAFSEFGRRVTENASAGTDHGTAGPVFLAGSRVRPGIFGATPSLTDLVDDNLRWSVDFRRIYATVIERWLRGDPERVLGGTFEPLDLFRA